jgi:hypothetical protein
MGFAVEVALKILPIPTEVGHLFGLILNSHSQPPAAV